MLDFASEILDARRESDDPRSDARRAEVCVDESFRQAIRPAVAFLTAWLGDGEDYPLDLLSSATLQFVNGLSDTEAEELFIGSIPLLTKGLLNLLSDAVQLEPLDVLRQIAADR